MSIVLMLRFSKTESLTKYPLSPFNPHQKPAPRLHPHGRQPVKCKRDGREAKEGMWAGICHSQNTESREFTQIKGSICIHFKKHGILTGFTGC